MLAVGGPVAAVLRTAKGAVTVIALHVLYSFSIEGRTGQML